MWPRSPIVSNSYGLLVHSKPGVLVEMDSKKLKIPTRNDPEVLLPWKYVNFCCFSKATKSSKIPGDPGEISGFFGHISTLSANPRMQGFGSEPSEDISSRRQRFFRSYRFLPILCTELWLSQRQELEGVVNKQLSMFREGLIDHHRLLASLNYFVIGDPRISVK